jgi:hypothetical protein
MGPTCHSLSLLFYLPLVPSPPRHCARPLGTGARPTAPPLFHGGLKVVAMEVSPPILSSPSSCSPARRGGPATPPTPPRRPQGGGHRGAVAVLLPAAGADRAARGPGSFLKGRCDA